MKTCRILLVEDNGDDEFLTLRALDKAALHDVDVAHDGIEAIEMLLGEKSGALPLPDLVILDLRLPMVDGVEVLENIRNDFRTRDLPVIILTSSEDIRDKEACFRLGIAAFISKPLQTGVLQEILNHLCRPAPLTLNQGGQQPQTERKSVVLR